MTIFALLLMAWLAGLDGPAGLKQALVGQKVNDYYNLLVDGFRDGSTALKIRIDPDWLSDDPLVRARNARPNDASLFQGKFYLYFGVVPAVAVLLPYTLLTGQDLSPGGAVLVLVGAGFLVAASTLRRVQRALARAGPGRTSPAALLLLAFAGGTPVLLTTAGMYQIAIAGAYCCLACAWYCLQRCLESQARAPLWLALTSLAMGLAVGCRPITIVVLPLLAAVVLALYRRDRRGSGPGQPGTLGRLALAAVLPAAAIGAGLAAYNWVRFGRWQEFGVSFMLHQLGDRPMFQASFLWPNLNWYYLKPPVLSPFFPYFQPLGEEGRPADYYGFEDIHGQWLALGLALGVGIFWAATRRQSRLPAPWSLFCLVLGGAFLLLLGALLPLNGRADRYVADFQPTLMLLLGIVAAAAGAGGVARTGWRWSFGCLALAVSTANVLVGMALGGSFAQAHPRANRILSYYGNLPSHVLAQLGLVHYGPLRFKAVFPETGETKEEKLVVAGIPGSQDMLYATRYPGGLIRYRFFHEGFGGPTTDLLKVEAGREYLFEVDLGAFYPPRDHPFFDGWTSREVDRLKDTVRLAVDGQDLIRVRMKSYDAPPDRIAVGPPAGFTGQVGDVQRLPPRARDGAGWGTEPGIWSLQVEFPPGPTRGQPILSSGVSGAGNLLFTELYDASRLRFGLDQWGSGASYSRPLEIDRTKPHALEIFVGPQAVLQHWPGEWSLAPARLAAAASRLRVWLDHELILDTEISVHRDSYEFTAVGSNLQGFNTAEAYFSGTIRRRELTPAETRELLLRNLDPAQKP